MYLQSDVVTKYKTAAEITNSKLIIILSFLGPSIERPFNVLTL